MLLKAASVQEELAAVASRDDSKFLSGFFKTGPGEYGEGDVFLGLRVPDTRVIAKRYRELPLEEIYELLESEVHEHRLAGLVVLTERYKRAKTDTLRGELFAFYLDAALRGRVNNWDLVDVTAPTFGEWLLWHPQPGLLKSLAVSDVLWERRLAMLFCFAHIRAMQFDVPVDIATMLLHDKQDLMHKAVGWMLREAGNRDVGVLRAFLAEHHTTMPRTMLRYAIEKLEPAERARWMAR